MAGVFEDGALSNIGVSCGGGRPWLGEDRVDQSTCGRSLRVVQRGASNVYFPHVASSIYLPLWGEQAKRPTVEILENPKHWRVLTQALVDGKIDIERCRIVCELEDWRGVDPNELQLAAQKRLEGESTATSNLGPLSDPATEEEHFRQAEYDALRTGRGGVQTDLETEVKDATKYYRAPIAGFFQAITLVKKLRETRVLYGFSRGLPDDGRAYDAQINALRLSPSLNWLPAIMVRGEGIFFELDRKKLDSWLENARIIQRIERLTQKYNEARRARQQSERPVSPKFVLMHTLAHMLINQLSYDCGYGSSSLRERIYCDLEMREYPMNGILVYTASGDAEGSMGGLVRQGQPDRIEETLFRALRKATWCSYDPICMESAGQGPDSCNLAACHGCAILPETSCEEGNRLLDRGVVVGLPGEPALGFFGEFVLNSQ